MLIYARPEDDEIYFLIKENSWREMINRLTNVFCALVFMH